MKKWMALLVAVAFVAFSLPGCKTSKPADEVKDAKERVKKKAEEAEQNQKDADPGE
jgi:hypothetical protein